MAKKQSARASDDLALLLRVLDGLTEVIGELRNAADLAQGFAAKGQHEAYSDLDRFVAELLSLSREGKSVAVSELRNAAAEWITGNGRLGITFVTNPQLVAALTQLGESIRRWLPASSQSFDRAPLVLDGREETVAAWEKSTREVNEDPARVEDDACRGRIATAVAKLLTVLDGTRSNVCEKLVGKPQNDGQIKRSWTQESLDRAIREYFADRAGEANRLKRLIAKNEDGAVRQAQKTFGRNAIERALGVRSPDMVTKSPVWQELADELGIPRGRSHAGSKIGLDFALEAQAEAEAEAEGEDMELLRLIRRKLSSDVAEATLEKLRRGKMTPAEVREMIELLESA